MIAAAIAIRALEIAPARDAGDQERRDMLSPLRRFRPSLAVARLAAVNRSMKTLSFGLYEKICSVSLANYKAHDIIN